jgi:hypothetical protein
MNSKGNLAFVPVVEIVNKFKIDYGNTFTQEIDVVLN